MDSSTLPHCLPDAWLPAEFLNLCNSLTSEALHSLLLDLLLRETAKRQSRESGKVTQAVAACGSIILLSLGGPEGPLLLVWVG